MIIKDILVNEILDSRGEPTLEVIIQNKEGQNFLAQVPCGKSVSTKEAKVLSCQTAKNILDRFLKKELMGRDFKSIAQLDNFLISLDRTENKEKLGGNLVLGISMAFSRALAAQSQKELWQVLKEEFFPETASISPPYIFSNLINGGLHAKNNLDFQEYMVVVKPHQDISENIKKLKNFYNKLGEFLKKERGLSELSLGDEGGYSLNFKNNFEPLEVLSSQIKSLRLENDFSLALDAAASGLWQNGFYKIGGQKLSAAELEKLYLEAFDSFALLYSLEDPFAESDPESFGKLLQKAKGKLIVGDDLTCTNPQNIEKAGKEKFINGVIIKPNQIGAVSETCQAIKTAQKYGIKVIISHRSGETKDNFILHLARACSAFGVKIGAPFGLRLSKFDELERIYV